MKMPEKTWVRGAAAGVIGAIALAVWFLAVDFLRTSPLDTLRLAAGLAFGRAEVGLSALAAYTVLHVAVFAAVGVAVALAIEKAGIPLFPLSGAVVGFFLFDLAFYGSVVVRGADIVQQVGWPVMLAGNVLAGLALAGVLRAGRAQPAVRFRDTLREASTARTGVLAGLAGAFAVMLWFFVVDLAMGRALYTPGALGSALFYGARGTEEVRITVQTVLGYTGLHLALFLAAGLALAGLAEAARRHPPFLLGAALGLFTLQALFTGLIAALMSWMLGAISWWSFVAANMAAVLAMGVVVARRYPEMRKNLDVELEEELAAPGVR
jgi:hypothetical protein